MHLATLLIAVAVALIGCGEVTSEPAVVETSAWGQNDPIFIAAGAEAYRQHLDSPEVHLFDTGHFVLEEDAPRILPLIRSFLRQVD